MNEAKHRLRHVVRQPLDLCVGRGSANLPLEANLARQQFAAGLQHRDHAFAVARQ